MGLQDKITVGDLYDLRDWGHAKDYVHAFWKMLNESAKPTDYVVGTGKAYSCKEFIEKTFRLVGGFRKLKWEGAGYDEKLKVDGKVVVEIDRRFFRPGRVPFLRANPSKIKRELGW